MTPNPLCAQGNSASYPQQDDKWVVIYELQGKGPVWLIRKVVVCLLAANSGSNFTDAVNGWLQYQLMPIRPLTLARKQ